MGERAYPSEVIREAEKPLLAAGVPLMARASWSLARFSIALLRRTRGQVTGARVSVLAGPGNNAGDALFAAARLATAGAHVTVVTCFARTHAEGLAAARRAGASILAVGAEVGTEAGAEVDAEIVRELSRSDLVLDGILGTGGRRPLPEHLGDLIRQWRGTGPGCGQVIAVDVPSDLVPDQDSSHPAPEDRIHADHTVTFGGLKSELIDPRVRRFTGTVHVIDIGLELDESLATAEVMLASELEARFPRPRSNAHKYSRGVVGIVAGSRKYPGAGVLTSASAVNTGIGMVRYLGSAEVAGRVLDRHAEVVTSPGRVDALVLGPGAPEREHIDRALGGPGGTDGFGSMVGSDEPGDRPGQDVPLVLDAGALDLVTTDTLLQRPAILTPHAGELAGLLGRLLGSEVTASRIDADPCRWARLAAAATGHIVLLKGPQTVIACPDGYCVLPERGPSSLATAGSGDVLAGVLGALLAAHRATARDSAARNSAAPISGRGEVDRSDDASITAADGDVSRDEAPERHRELARIAGLAVLLHNAAGWVSVNASELAAAIADITRELVHPADGILDQ